MESINKVKRYLDKDGRIREWPSKKEMKRLILEYLAEKFESNIDYSEKEVNSIISENHTFNDYFILRRELIENGFLNRERDCSRYWRVERESK
jgi:hypothetical protein